MENLISVSAVNDIININKLLSFAVYVDKKSTGVIQLEFNDNDIYVVGTSGYVVVKKRLELPPQLFYEFSDNNKKVLINIPENTSKFVDNKNDILFSMFENKLIFKSSTEYLECNIIKNADFPDYQKVVDGFKKGKQDKIKINLDLVHLAQKALGIKECNITFGEHAAQIKITSEYYPGTYAYVMLMRNENK